MPENKIENEVEYILSVAMSRCGNIHDAQDLTQETFLSALLYQEKNGIIDNPRAFLSTLLNRKYYDMLRRKYRIPTVSIGEGFDLVDDADFTEALSMREEAESIRREVAYLTESYRSVVVKHYFQGKGVNEISSELGLPVGTVKSRLNFGRKQMKKGFETMIKYQENSYMPQRLLVQNSGICGINAEPTSLTEGDILAQNLLILAYDKPATIGELAKAIGVASAYVEPIINRLVDGELMKRMGDGRVYTDFIIYHASDYVKYIREAEAFVENHIDAYIDSLASAIKELRETTFYSKRLERFMMIQIAESGLYESIESTRKNPQIFPDRPNGGKWIAFGTIYPENYKIPEDKKGKEEYMLAGRRCTQIDLFLGAENLRLYNYETSLDPNGWHKSAGYGFDRFQEVESNMLKLFYLLKKNISFNDAALDVRIIKSIPLMEERGFLTTKNKKPEPLIPILSHAEEKVFWEICARAQRAFGENIRDPLAAWCETHVKALPSHLTSVPDQKRTMPYEPSSMMFVYAAIEKGIHPRELGYPCPETFAVFD